MNSIRVLILDDEQRITDELAEFLKRKKYTVFEANEVKAARQILDRNQIDIMILDIRLKDANGLDILKEVKLQYPEIEVIMITGHGDMDTVIESMRLGAIDFLKKPFRTADVKIAIERTGKFVKMQQELKQVKTQNSLISKELETMIEKDFIGESQAICQVRDISLSAAKYPDVSVLITGESGTGKEIIARIIHFASDRKKHHFFPVNCSAIPETLMESEFFGHKKGTFTGALSDKKGVFELTDGGTLFLDEIADMPLPLQAKLLRVIEEKRVKRIGDDKEIAVDVRIVAASNRNLEKLVEEKKFRLDLFHRLNTIMISIPPLRNRKEDISPLLQHFVFYISQKMKRKPFSIHSDVVPYLKQYNFPGNVRELKNITERALILCQSNLLTQTSFPLNCKTVKTDELPVANFHLEANEKKLIQAAMQETDNNQTKAAELLGISRHALIRRLQKM